MVLLYTSVQGIGMSFNIHFCDDRITEINVLDIEADCCCAGYNTLKDNCCDDEQVYAKDNSEHAASSQLNINKNIASKSIITSYCSPIQCYTSKKYLYIYSDTSPPLEKENSWLLFSTLRL